MLLLNVTSASTTTKLNKICTGSLKGLDPRPTVPHTDAYNCINLFFGIKP